MAFGTKIPIKVQKRYKSAKVQNARVTPEAVKKALDAQCGRGTPEGGRLGNNCTQIETGVNDSPPSKK